MKKGFLVSAFFLITMLQTVLCNAQPDVVPAQGGSPPGTRGLGIGIVLGEPTGFNAKLLIAPPAAFDLGIAWSFANIQQSGFNFVVYADYLFHLFGIVNVPYGQFGFYCGAGGLINIRADSFGITLRLPLGATYILEKLPLDIFFEIVPGMEVFPSTAFRAFAGLGVRYWFKW